MVFKAESNYISLLMALPETGMGYQFIEAIREGKSYSEEFVVINGELIVQRNGRFMEFRRQMMSEGYSRLMRIADTISLSPPRLLPRRRTMCISPHGVLTRERYERAPGGREALENETEFTSGIESFVRLSPCDNDSRVDKSDQRLLPGSYATTLADYQTCRRLADDPADRYALPPGVKITVAFHVRPITIDQMQTGVVCQTSDREGGGIEVFFPDGTSHYTLARTTGY